MHKYFYVYTKLKYIPYIPYMTNHLVLYILHMFYCIIIELSVKGVWHKFTKIKKKKPYLILSSNMQFCK